MQKQSVFLIGFMGVGKTTIGKKIANKLGLQYIDVDQEIEQSLGLSINSIFEKYGEDFFRKEESKMLEKIATQNEQAIISVGGGLPCFNNTMEIMNSIGITCYLHRPAKELFQRLKNSKEKRPLLRGLDDEQLMQFIVNKLSEREMYYNQAKYKISREQQEVMKIINIIGLADLIV